jgi:SAM-dependent methyltransferase
MNEPNKQTLVNDRAYLEDFYSNICLQAGYAEGQNKHFMEEILNHIDEDIIKYLSQDNITILDNGCGMGFGTSLLINKFPNAQLSGFDVIEYAIEKAREFFPKINFKYDYYGKIDDMYDVVISSHCLEHYIDPVDFFNEILKNTKKYCIVMCPYNEFPLCICHRSTINENTLVEEISFDDMKFKQIDMQIFDGVYPWLPIGFKNILFVYERII